MEEAANSPSKALLRLNECLIHLQSIVRCSICCSTLREPVTPNCNHAFCKECLDGVFQRRFSIECPVCRQKITKRSARTPSEHVKALVKQYIELVEKFKGEIKDNNPIPKDKFILESQAVTQAPGRPLQLFNLKPSERPVSKKRKNAEASTKSKKMARHEENDENFAVQSAFVKDNAKNRKNDKDQHVFVEPLPLSGRKVQSSVNQKTNSPNQIQSTEEKSVEVEKHLSKASSSVEVENNMKRLEPEQKCAIRFPIPVAAKVEETKPMCSPYVEEKPFSRDFRPSVHHNLSDLDDAIKHRKSMYPKCDDIEAFFLLFPTAQALFKKNLSTLLRELGVCSYKELSSLEGQSSPIACQTEEIFTKELRTIGCQTEKKTNEKTVACQTENNLTQQTTVCQTKNDEMEEEEVVPASEPEIQNTVSTACQTEITVEVAKLFWSIEKTKSIVQPSEGAYRFSSESERLQLSNSICAPSSFDSAYYDKHSETKNYALPPKPIIVISRRQSSHDNDIVNLFKKTFGNTQVRTELTDKATHLVMMNSRDNCAVKDRSLLYVQSIIRRMEIVNRKWIEDCLESKTLLNTIKYKIETFYNYPWYANLTEADTPVFKRVLFYIPYKFFPSNEVIQREQIIQIIKSAGGQIAPTAEEFLKAATVVARAYRSYTLPKYSTCIILFSSSCKEPEAARCLSQDLKAPVVSAEYVFDCIVDNFMQTPEDYFIKPRLNQ